MTIQKLSKNVILTFVFILTLAEEVNKLHPVYDFSRCKDDDNRDVFRASRTCRCFQKTPK